MWIDYDICFCGNSKECPKRNECTRAMTPAPGIYTYSSFYEKGKDCEYFMDIDNLDDEERDNEDEQCIPDHLY